jgi:hypothetical protein
MDNGTMDDLLSWSAEGAAGKLTCRRTQSPCSDLLPWVADTQRCSVCHVSVAIAIELA